MLTGIGTFIGAYISIFVLLNYIDNILILVGFVLSIIIGCISIFSSLYRNYFGNKKDFYIGLFIGIVLPPISIMFDFQSYLNVIFVSCFLSIISFLIILPMTNIQILGYNKNHDFLKNNNEFVKKPTTNNFILKEGYYLVNGYIGGNNLKYVDELINKYEKVVKEKDDGLCSAFNSYKICYNNFVNFLEISRKHIINKNISIKFDNKMLQYFGNIIESNELLIEGFQNIYENNEHNFIYNTQIIRQSIILFIKNAIPIYNKFIFQFYKLDKQLWKDILFDSNVLLTKIFSKRNIKILIIIEDFNKIIEIPLEKSFL